MGHSLPAQAIGRYEAARISGTALVSVRSFVESRFGLEGWEQIARRVTNQTVETDLLQQSFVASGWYPFSLAVEITDAIVELANGTRILRDLAIYNLDFATKMIFRAIFKVGTPGFMISRSDQVWRKYYSRGRMTSEVTDKSALVRVHDFPLPVNYDRVVMHSAEAVLLKAGANWVSFDHLKCVRDGDEFCETKYIWG